MQNELTNTHSTTMQLNPSSKPSQLPLLVTSRSLWILFITVHATSAVLWANKNNTTSFTAAFSRSSCETFSLCSLSFKSQCSRFRLSFMCSASSFILDAQCASSESPTLISISNTVVYFFLPMSANHLLVKLHTSINYIPLFQAILLLPEITSATKSKLCMKSHEPHTQLVAINGPLSKKTWPTSPATHPHSFTTGFFLLQRLHLQSLI